MMLRRDPVGGVPTQSLVSGRGVIFGNRNEGCSILKHMPRAGVTLEHPRLLAWRREPGRWWELADPGDIEEWLY
jgi:hypothetical protein